MSPSSKRRRPRTSADARNTPPARTGLRDREERFRSLAEHATDAIVVIDANDRIHFANEAVARVFGYEPAELASIPFTSLMPERFRERHRQGLARYAASGKRQLRWDGVELPGLHRDGREIPLEITFGAYEQGGTQYFSGIMRDISERKRVEERLQQALAEATRRATEEAALFQAARSLAAVFTTSDVVDRIATSALQATAADGAFVLQLDFARQEIFVASVAGSLTPQVGLRRPYQGSLTQQVIEREEPLIFADAQDATDEITRDLARLCPGCAAVIIPLLDSGQPVGALVLLRSDGREFHHDEIARAVTFGHLAALAFRKVHLLADSERRREEIERVTESRARLMRGFSHDLRNPLGAADGHAQLLQAGLMGALSDKQQDSVARIRRALRAALRLIDDLLHLARAEAGEIELNYGPLDVREAAREMAEEYRAQAEAKQLTLSTEIPPEFPLTMCDAGRVRQILGNLLSNAIKYTDHGDVRIRVETCEGADGLRPGHWIVARVSDTGRGIAADDLPLLFHEFVRLKNAGVHGAGIGLAIARRMACAMGGDITARSALGQGSEFTLWLPLTSTPPDSKR